MVVLIVILIFSQSCFCVHCIFENVDIFEMIWTSIFHGVMMFHQLHIFFRDRPSILSKGVVEIDNYLIQGEK